MGIFADRQAKGRAGEDEAVRALKKAGYRIKERNYRTPHGEIDIIANDNGVLVFVEVKYRSTERFGTPAHGVDNRKRRNMGSSAQFYMLKNDLINAYARFDVVSVWPEGGALRSEVMKNVFDIES